MRFGETKTGVSALATIRRTFCRAGQAMGQRRPAPSAERCSGYKPTVLSRGGQPRVRTGHALEIRGHVFSYLAHQHVTGVALWGRPCAPSRLFCIPWGHCNARFPSKAAVGGVVGVE